MKRYSAFLFAGLALLLCLATVSIYWLVAGRSPAVRPPIAQPPVVAPALPPPVPIPAEEFAPPSPPVRRGKPPIKDPEARAALANVGRDVNATLYWTQAINNPELSDHERKDLIEDLNEDGFPNPKRITQADLPLIESRLAIIELLAPEAMDKVNADAFQEAHKDLVNMRNRLNRESGR